MPWYNPAGMGTVAAMGSILYSSVLPPLNRKLLAMNDVKGDFVETLPEPVTSSFWLGR